MIKNLLITGSNGYLGSNFINQYKNKYKFKFFSLLNEKLEDINFDNIDIILHCAALVHQKINHPYEKYHKINVNYPLKLAKLAKQNSVKQFVFISTIAVYGEDEEKLDENFKQAIMDFSRKKLPQIYELLDRYRNNINIIIFKSRDESDNYITNIKV